MGGFVDESIDNLEPQDASDFMAAVDAAVVQHQKGTFLVARSCAKEQIFWEHEKSTIPRRITLWLEPIITMSGLMRLHRDFGWPIHRLGLQSKTWAFDLVGYANDGTEQLVCEVKKTRKEVDRLIEFMMLHRATPNDANLGLKGAELNAMRKVIGLRKCAAPIFWVLGPGRYEQVFGVTYTPNGHVTLTPIDVGALQEADGAANASSVDWIQ
ncbi:hypothetical protein ABT364_23615 [Massilia sp. SR12]